MPDDFKVPSRKEHDLEIRRLWKVCFILAIIIFVITGSITGTMFYKGMDPKVIVAISTAIFQVMLLSYGMAFFVPAFITSLKKMGLGVEMSRAGLEIGRQTAENLKDFKDELKPIVDDGKELVKEIRPVVEEVTKVVHEGRKVFDDLAKEVREGNGQLQGKIGDTLKKAIFEARKTLQGAEGDFEQLIWTKVEGFLENVFESNEEEGEAHERN